MRPFFGYHMPDYTFPGLPPEGLFGRVTQLAQAAEGAGFDMITVMDHFYQIRGVGSEEQPMLEAYATLAALAARTERVALGCLVTGVTYRNPALLAKTVTTLDVISGGRAVLGLGAAWNESEHIGLGFEFPPIRERFDRLEEALEICRLMFTEERPTFTGRHYHIEAAFNRPRPIQAGGPRIMIGGTGERRTLRIAARYADMTNWFGDLERLRHLQGVFEEHCAVVGRDPATVLKTVMPPFVLARDPRDGAQLLAALPPERREMTEVLSPEQAAERLQAYLDAGFGGFIFRNAAMPTPEAIAAAGELIGLMR
jgi:F420-dependent oxidoreductase-like protein